MVSRQQKNENTTMRVYKYGLFLKDDLPKVAIKKLYNANKLWNNLVEQHNDNYKTIISARCDASSEYAKLTESIEKLRDAIKEASDDIRKSRIKAKTTDNTHPEIAPYVNKLKELIQRKNDALGERKTKSPKIDMKPITKSFRDSNKDICSVKDKNLYSLTASQIRENFETARDKVLSDPRSSRLNFHRFDGAGFYHFRFCQKGKSRGGAKWNEIFEGETWNLKDNRLKLTGVKKVAHKKNTTKQWIGLKAKLGGNWVDFDLIFHRPIPDNAIIKQGQIIRERIGTRFRYFLCLTVELPASGELLINPDQIIGIDINWRNSATDDVIKTLKVAGLVYYDQSNENILKDEVIYLPKKIQAASDHVKSLETNYQNLQEYWVKNLNQHCENLFKMRINTGSQR